MKEETRKLGRKLGEKAEENREEIVKLIRLWG